MANEKYFHFEGEIASESIKELLVFISENECNLLIGINSGGGSDAVAKYLLEVFNRNKDRLSIVVTAGVYSAAFRLVHLFEGIVLLSEGCKGMYHYGTIESVHNALGMPSSPMDKNDISNLVLSRNSDDKYATKFMTAKELKQFKKGEDVYFDYRRMKEIFQNRK